eukprot:1188835-Prorocentrum_minimum.AAC.4
MAAVGESAALHARIHAASRSYASAAEAALTSCVVLEKLYPPDSVCGAHERSFLAKLCACAGQWRSASEHAGRAAKTLKTCYGEDDDARGELERLMDVCRSMEGMEGNERRTAAATELVRGIEREFAAFVKPAQ